MNAVEKLLREANGALLLVRQLADFEEIAIDKLEKKYNRKPTQKEVTQYADSLRKQHGLDWLLVFMETKWEGLQASVIRESGKWGVLAEKVVSAAEQLTEKLLEVCRLERVPVHFSECTRFQNKVVPELERAITVLERYEKPPMRHQLPAHAVRRRRGRPALDPELSKDILKGWEEYESPEGRRKVDDYLASRPEVADLKSEQARKREIVRLRRILESAIKSRNRKKTAIRNKPGTNPRGD